MQQELICVVVGNHDVDVWIEGRQLFAISLCQSLHSLHRGLVFALRKGEELGGMRHADTTCKIVLGQPDIVEAQFFRVADLRDLLVDACSILLRRRR